MSNRFTELSQLERDYDALVEKFKSIIPNLTDDWNDFSDSDIGMFLVKSMIAIKDMQAYHFDKQVLERYLPTVTERRNLISILELVGYPLSSYKSCRVRCTLSFTGAATITIKRGTVFSFTDDTNGDITYTYIGDDVTVSSGDTILLYQGELMMWPAEIAGSSTVFNAYVDTNGNTVSSLASDTNELVSIAISEENESVAIDGSSFLSLVTLGEETRPAYLRKWKEVTSFIENVATETDYAEYDSGVVSGNPPLYRLYVDRDNKTYIQFYNIETLLNVSNLKVRYLKTSGKQGNIAAGSELHASIVVGSNTGFQVDATVVGVDHGGADPETIAQAQLSVPAYTRSMNRAVTIADYMQLVRSFLSGNPGSAFTAYDAFAVSIVDAYKNDNAGDSKIADYPVQAYIVNIYGYVADQGVPLADFTEYQDTNGAPYKTVYRSQAVKIEGLDADSYQDSSWFYPTEKNLYDYLAQKRMVGVRCFVDDYYFSGDTRTARDALDPVHSSITRFYIRVAYSSRVSHVVDIQGIIADIANMYPNNDSAFGRTVYVSDIIMAIMARDPMITVNPVGGVTLYTVTDATGEDAFSSSVRGSDFTVTNSVTAKLNEMLAFGGVVFIEV